MQPARPVGNGEHQAAPDSACHGASPRAVEDSATPREEETEGDEEGGGIVVDNTIVCVGCRCERWRTAATPRPGPGWGSTGTRFAYTGTGTALYAVKNTFL